MKAPLLSVLPWLVLGLSSAGHAAPPAALKPAEAYRKYALRNEGDIERGRALFFNEERLLCAKCHSVDGTASKSGPDLQSAGDAFGRRDLVDAVLFPSATISPGYNTVIVETTKGEAFQGVLKGKQDVGVQLMGIDGKLVTVPTAEVKERHGSDVSLMPEGQHAGLSEKEFTDLIEYLTSLKQPESTASSHHGMPADIAPLAKPITARPFVESDFPLFRKPETGLTSFRQIPGTPNTFFVLHQKGTMWKVVKKETGEDRSVFLDLTEITFSARGPNGLLDVAFHPKFRENRKYYLFYQIFVDKLATTLVVERQFSEDFQRDSGQPHRELIRITSVAEDHSGGCLLFGRDGMLYLTMGDTGPHNDPNGHAQNMDMLLGKVLRIDVDHTDPGLAYAIPRDNPFVGQPGVRPEIWASGLRNPWRFCFDRANGDLWLADVGQDREEEVDLIQRGANYGWNVSEGFEAFSNQYRKEGRTYTPPVFAYRRKYGNSITGGHVYRGPGNPSFQGVYVFGDYNSKRIFGLTQKDGKLVKVRQLGTLPQRISSFSEDEEGNLYAIGLEGMIYRLDLSDAVFE